MEDEKYIESVNDLSITSKGKIDRTRKLVEQDMSINYSNDISLPIGYKQNDNLYGLTSSMIVNTYISVKNENLQGLYEKFEGDTTTDNLVTIPDEIDTGILEINLSYIKGEVQKLQEIIQDNVTEANFSKVDENSLALTLDQNQTMTIVTKLLEEVKNSKILPENIKEAVAEIITAARNAKETEADFLKVVVKKDGNITITVKDILTLNIRITENNITISTNNDNGSVIITINKIGSGERVEYDIDYTVIAEETSKIYLKAKYSNISQDTANENYIFGMESTDGDNEIVYEYNFVTEKVFVPGMSIEPITASNSFVINDANKEYLTEMLGPAIMNRIILVNRNQMEQLGLEETQNPLIYATPFGYMLYQFSSLDTLDDDNQEPTAEEPESQEPENQTGWSNLNEL